MLIISQFKKTLQNSLDTFVLPDTAVIGVSVINLTSLVQLTIFSGALLVALVCLVLLNLFLGSNCQSFMLSQINPT